MKNSIQTGIHIINEFGKKEVIPNSNSSKEEVSRDVTIDLDWYNEHGYRSADVFFEEMRSKYNYLGSEFGVHD